MNDHIKEEIPLYLSGELTESRNRQIEAHAAACEKCRAALTKARAKQARHKREALKKAAPDRMPNLFLTRQGKSLRGPSSSGGFPKGMVLLLVVAAVGYWGYGKWKHPASAPVEEPVTEAPFVAPDEVVKAAPPKPAAAKVVAQPVLSTTTPKVPLVLPVLQTWKGAESAILEPRLVVARRAEAFEKLWAEMQLVEARPSVDFSGSMVLAVFAGAVPVGTTIEIGKIEEMDDAMYAPYRVITTTAAPEMTSHPYLLAVVPRTDRKIKLTRRE